MRKPFLRKLSLLLAPALLAMAGCGNSLVTTTPAISAISITPRTGSIDTNCTGCNAANAQGNPVQQFTATLAGGGPAEVVWSISGGDAVSGPGSINQLGQYTPPSYLTADHAEVVVTATLAANPSLRAYSVLSITPGFLQPLTPENVAMGANGRVTITGVLAEAGGSSGIHFELAGSPGGQGSGGQGSLAASCQRDSQTFTSCTVTYSAPASVHVDRRHLCSGYCERRCNRRACQGSAVVLVNTAGVTSNPAAHQGQLPATVLLGSSGGNNRGLRHARQQIVDCCSGTLGALVEDASKRAYLLSNNHVLAKSDHASVGDTIIAAWADRQQLHAAGRRRGRSAGGLAHRLAAAQLEADQRRRGDCASHIAHGGRLRQHS